MRKRDHIRAWACHAALNLGAVVECLVHVVVPPQFDHTPDVVVGFARSTPWREFAYGTGFWSRPIGSTL